MFKNEQKAMLSLMTHALPQHTLTSVRGGNTGEEEKEGSSPSNDIPPHGPPIPPPLQ